MSGLAGLAVYIFTAMSHDDDFGGQRDIYTRGPFGERLNPLKDLTPDEIFVHKSKHVPKLTRTIGYVPV